MHSRQFILIIKCKFKSNTKEQNELKIKTNEKEINITIQIKL